MAQRESPTLLSTSRSSGWILLSSIWIPDQINVIHGSTSFATFALHHVAPPPDDKERLRVCKYDSILVSQLHIPANSNGIDDQCYAYVTIIMTHEEDRRTTHYLRKGLDFMIRTYEKAVE